MESLTQKKCEITIQIPYTDETLEHIFKAEEELMKAGVSFDTGALIQEQLREWSFDWSLKGAKIIFKKMKK